MINGKSTMADISEPMIALEAAQERLKAAQRAAQQAQYLLDEALADEGERIISAITSSDLITLIPHGPTSCDDDGLQNAYTNRNGVYRCARCVLLSSMRSSQGRMRVELSITISDPSHVSDAS
jgi:hypothetical protein